MFGLTAEGVSTVVLRALVHASEWSDYDWRLVDAGALGPGPAPPYVSSSPPPDHDQPSSATSHRQPCTSSLGLAENQRAVLIFVPG